MEMIDMTGREVHLPDHPVRIISVVPSQTELLYDLGLGDKVIGITKFCVHPEEWFRHKQRVGGTKNLDIEKIKYLEPDLVIANKEENERSDIEAIRKFCPVWTSDIKDLGQAMEMISAVGKMTATSQKAKLIIDDIQAGFSELRNDPVKKVAYFIWYRPWMTIGKDSFINDMLSRNGWENVYQDLYRYPETDLQDLKNRNPEIVMLSSEPFPFKEKHIAEIKEILADASIILVDGEYFSWYGSRLTGAPTYFKKIELALNNKEIH